MKKIKEFILETLEDMGVPEEMRENILGAMEICVMARLVTVFWVLGDVLVINCEKLGLAVLIISMFYFEDLEKVLDIALELAAPAALITVLQLPPVLEGALLGINLAVGVVINLLLESGKLPDFRKKESQKSKNEKEETEIKQLEMKE